MKLKWKPKVARVKRQSREHVIIRKSEIRMWCLSKREALIQLHVILVICLLWVFSICLAE